MPIARNEGLNARISGHISTAGCEPSTGCTNSASQTPSAVGMSTSRAAVFNALASAVSRMPPWRLLPRKWKLAALKIRLARYPRRTQPSCHHTRRIFSLSQITVNFREYLLSTSCVQGLLIETLVLVFRFISNRSVNARVKKTACSKQFGLE